MSKNEIRIGCPRIVNAGEYVRLEADTVWCFDEQRIEKTLFYEIQNSRGRYLTSELSDPFVLALIELAMEKACDIRYDAPMSEDLKYRLEQYLIPIFTSEIEEYHFIEMIGETTQEDIKSEMAVGTGFSGGVDSFYTVLTRSNITYETKRVTHLLLALNGAAMTGMTEELDATWFNEELKRFQSLAEEMGLQLIGVNSNVSLINNYKRIQKGADIVITASFVHALRKLFGLYYWASEHEAVVHNYDTADGRIEGPLAVSFVESGSLRFCLSGMEASRVQRVEYIADNPVVQKGLTVCGQPDNCGHCFKCLRTMAELYSVGKLDKFDKVFDIDDYKKHFTSKLARELTVDSPAYYMPIIRNMKKNGIRIPMAVYFKKYLFFNGYYFFKKKLKNNKVLMNLYYNHGWDKRMGEGTHSKELINARMNGKGK